MDAKKLIELIELKDKYVCALMDYYLDKIEEDQLSNDISNLQQYIDDVCDAWAKTFIALYNREFSDRQTQLDVFRHLDNLGVKQGYTGKRFSEALYKQLHYLFLDSQEQINEKQF